MATPHSLASATGLHLLRAGGSAVDALIGAHAVLCAVYPHWTGIGGDGFWMVAEPGRSEPVALNASGPAARLASRDFYLAAGHPDRIPERGPLSALTVPGAVDGWQAVHERFGRLPWADLFADAIHLAREGFAVSRSLAFWAALRQDELRRRPALAARFLAGNRVPREGDRLRLPELAASLDAIALHGARAALYEGELAERVCRSLAAEGSPLRPEDFAAYQSEWVRPVSSSYRGHRVFQLPPNSQGFTALQVLNLVEGFDVVSWGDGTADFFHHLAETVKVAFADRDAWLTDPRFLNIPLAELVSREYADRRRHLIRPERAWGIDQIPAGIPFPGKQRGSHVGGDTVYLCAVDVDGLAVSSIQSLFQDFGSMTEGGGTGIVMQNRGSFFSLDPEVANTLEPGKRTFHTLMPAMLCRDGKPHLVFGSMGGGGQPQTHAALVTRLVDFGYDVQQAIEAPRWVVGQTLGKRLEHLYLEGRIPDGVATELTRRGQAVRIVRDWDEDMGHAQAIRIDLERGCLEGGADPRGDGAALGY